MDNINYNILIYNLLQYTFYKLVRKRSSVQASATAQHIKSADRCHREVTFVVYMQWETRLPSAIYTTNNTPCAGCSYYLLAQTGSTSAAKLSLINSSKERRHRASLFCFIFESVGGGGWELAHQQTQKKTDDSFKSSALRSRDTRIRMAEP